MMQVQQGGCASSRRLVFSPFLVLCAMNMAVAEPSYSTNMAQQRTAQQVKRSAFPRIEGLRIQFFYERSGRLSGNIAPPARFNAHNTMIGEGDAEEPANDLIVSAALSINEDQASVDTPLVITVTGKGGNVLARRTFEGLFFTRGKIVKAVFVPNVACAGLLKVEANVGTEAKRTSVTLDCGE